MRSSANVIACVGLVFSLQFAAFGQPTGTHAASAEARAAKAYQDAARGGPLALEAFLADFPKGADLHVHLSGAVYAESFIRAAGEDGLCVDPVALKFVKPPCEGKPGEEKTGDRRSVPASSVPADQDLYDRLVDAFSMRSFVPSAGTSGHDQFFATFDRFNGLGKKHAGEWVDEVATRAAAENQQYLELMETPAFQHAAKTAHEIGWNADFAQMRQALLDHGVLDEVDPDREHARTAESDRKNLEHCGTTDAMAACKVEIRYIYQILRGHAPEQVFAQTLLGFETVQASMEAHEDTWVGINFVMPEDGYISMRDYSLQMKMVDYLHRVYPKVHISLHAGELAPGLVPPEGMRFHIRQAVEWGHAERIGHGVDAMYENDARGLLKEMAEKHVMVEVNLTSNEGILGIAGPAHPFPLYMAAHVPVALSTDDEGVSRIDLTHEYVRAAADYHLSYATLKQLARTGIEHSFQSGDGLWATQDDFTAAAKACKGEAPGSAKPSAKCKVFLDSNEKAASEWELEGRFRKFDAKF